MSDNHVIEKLAAKVNVTKLFSGLSGLNTERAKAGVGAVADIGHRIKAVLNPGEKGLIGQIADATRMHPAKRDRLHYTANVAAKEGGTTLKDIGVIARHFLDKGITSASIASAPSIKPAAASANRLLDELKITRDTFRK